MNAAREVRQRNGRKTNRAVLRALAPVWFGLARSLLVGVISELTGFFQGLDALATGRQPARGFESGFGRLPVSLGRIRFLCRHAACSILRRQIDTGLKCLFKLNGAVEISGNKKPGVVEVSKFS